MFTITVMLAVLLSQDTLEDQFINGPAGSLWKVTANGANIQREGTELVLRPNSELTSFPEMETVSGALPRDGDWRITVQFRIRTIGNYGTGLCLVSEGGQTLFRVHADRSLGGAVVAVGNAEVVRTVDWPDASINRVISNPSDWQIYEVTKMGQELTLRMGEMSLISVRAPSSEVKLRIGSSSLEMSPWDWTEIGVRMVKLEYFGGSKPAWMSESLAAREPESTPSEPGSAPFAAILGKRSRAAVALGVDTLATATVTVSAGGRPRVTGRSASLALLPLSTIELAPTFDRADVHLTNIELFLNGKLVRSEIVFAGKPLPTFTVETPQIPGAITRALVVASDLKRTRYDLMRLEIRNVRNNERVSFGLKSKEGHIVLEGDGIDVQSLDVFDAEGFVGQVSDASRFAADARRLPPGQHEFWIIATTTNGEVLPPCRSLIDVPARYTVTSEYENGAFRVEADSTSLPLRILRRQDSGAVKTRLYLHGAMVVESDEPEFDAGVSMLDVPTGNVAIEVVGVAADGTCFAPELVVFSVVSPFHDALQVRDARAKKLAAMSREMAKYDQDVVYWYERAKQEPAFRTYLSGKTVYASDEFGRVASIGYVDMFTVPGDAGKYLAECKAAIVRRAQHRLEIGRLQKVLGMRDNAVSTLRQVITEVGEESGIGLEANQELRDL